MAIIAKKFTHVRTYGVDSGNRWNVDKATKHGLKLGLGVWVDDDEGKTNAQIDLALTQVQDAATKSKRSVELDLVIGNEVNRTDNAKYNPAQIKRAMEYAKRMIPGHPGVIARVTTCFSGTVLKDSSDWNEVVKYCDTVVYLTVYPWYGNAAPNNIDPQMKWSWENGLQQVVALGRQVLIAEIGWPSEGGRDTSVENEKTNFEVTRKWVSGSNSLNMAFDTYWFEMFDEPWKTKEGPQGPHWGLFTKDSEEKFKQA